MTFCSRCGGKQKFSRENPEKNMCKDFIWICPLGHEVFTSERTHTCPVGTKCVRTKANNGFQTSHIPISCDEKDYKDQDYHSVNITSAFVKKTSI